MEQNIYDYLDFRAFLRDFFESQRRAKPYFTHRYFCKAAGFKTSGAIKLVIDGKRNLSRTSAIRISEAIEFTPAQREYFQTLVIYCQCKDPEVKRRLLFDLSQRRRQPGIATVESSQHEFYKEWFHTVVRECCEISGISQNPESIARAMWPRITAAKARESLQLLESLGFIAKERSTGRFHATQAAIATENDLDSEYVAHFNREMIRIALQAALHFPRQQREISGVTLRISRRCYTEIKKKLQCFKQELLQMALDDPDSDSIYQLNFQLFPLLTGTGEDS